RVARERRWALPSYAAFLRRLRETPRELVVLRREGPEALKALTPAQERDHGVFRALQAVSGDGHKLDLWCRWPDGTVSRPILVAFQDVYSGKVLAWRLGKTESAELVRLTLGDMVETFGVPEAAYLDNGMAWAAKTNTGGAPTRYRHRITEEEIAGTFTLLGIAVHWCLPYSGQSKPIERAFRDLCEYVARHPVCEGAYTGNRPENKPYTAGERAVALEDLEGLLASELAEHNARRGRRSAVCGGTLSFDEAFEASYANATVRKATREQRAIWLLASAVVTASRTSGEVRLHGNRYFDPVLARLQGKKLAVRYDPKDLHAGIHVYLLGGGYVCYAPRLGRPGFKDAEAAGEKAKTLKRARRAARELEAAADLLSPLEVAKALPKRLAPKPPAAKAVEVDFRRPLEKSVAWKVP
ncbi:MAG: Mu transposase C-terminal domain-containing protein, partial [Candidatus Methylomirabilis sp.]|nr:Mu transposase C-terminal domain-containing protein [Deltaproteobacteria bacterium]